jgi:hypothetical protein
MLYFEFFVSHRQLSKCLSSFPKCGLLAAQLPAASLQLDVSLFELFANLIVSHLSCDY